MPKIRRGGYVFAAWIGDHPPHHVHVYEDNRLIVKWDLEHGCPLEGSASRRIRKLIAELQAEGKL